jgi:hypothetical protein
MKVGKGFSLSLSPEQLALFPSYIGNYKRMGLLTETIDPERAALALKEAYRCAGKREPSLFLFFPSPLAGMIAAYLISNPESWKRMTVAAVCEGLEAIETLRESAPADLADWPLAVWTSITAQLATVLAYRPDRARWDEILLPEGVGASLATAIKEDPRTRFWKEMPEETRGGWPGNWDALWASVGPNTFQEMRAHITQVDVGIWSPVQNEIWETLLAIEQETLNRNGGGGIAFSAERAWVQSHGCGYGSQDADWLSWFAFWSKEMALKCGRQLYGLRAVNETCGWWWPFENVCIVTDRPAAIHFDAEGRLHSAAVPALLYRDGFGVYAWKGRRVERGVLMEPVTVERIEAERNAEIRRILVERYGASNYVRDAGATEIAADEWGVLYRKDQEGDEPIYVVKVICTTTGNEYFLGVDPEAYGGRAGTNVRAAVASTWRRRDNSLAFKSPEEYSPEVET